MIRFEDLYEGFKDRLEKEVDLGENPEKDVLLPPLDRILVTLYDSNQNVHRLQRELSNQKDLSVDYIRQTHHILSPAEEAVELLLSANFNFAP